ncbi:pineapple eye protein [Bactrocera neohumeralis]|uniref:pineapple eye protein n=1 Tax=Bactrocera neohumeralis TaxID=98809 RepID=UPI0021669292|nr:pineapple eye protein [Bactrocera neohumeralis]
MSEEKYKICDICKDKTNCTFDLLMFGDWQHSRDINVHYFCLLLSTNLPQRGKDCSGINGFLVRDIRKEITAASKRLCCYCGRQNASIQCFKCNEYFHLVCGRQNRCLYTFVDDFRSYCDECVPRKELQPVGLQKRPSSFERCSICRDQMGLYNEIMFIFGKCCNRGYAHNVCVQQYAMAAGYYLRCLWCRSKDFRESVRSQGIFVPDRDARWETQKGIYTDLHRGHNTCNMEVCLCPRGRDYQSGKWSVILCSLCGSVGAHNPICLLGKENAKEPLTIFKCATCANTEANVTNLPEKELLMANTNEVIDKSIFMTKNNANVNKPTESSLVPTFSEEDETMSCDSFVTVIPQTGSFSVVKNRTDDSVKNNSTMLSIGAESTQRVDNDTVIAVEETVLIHSTDSDSSNENSIILQNDVAHQDIMQRRDSNSCVEDNTNIVKETQSQQPLFIEDDETQVFVADTPRENITKETPIPNKTLSYEIQDDETQEFIENVSKIANANASMAESQSTIVASSRTTALCPETTLSLVCSQANSTSDNINQSPVVSSSSQLEEQEEWACFQVYEYDDAEGKCVGSATARINLSEERFAGLSLKDIEMNSSKLLKNDDIVDRCDDIGIFAKIQSIIAMYDSVPN